MVFFVCLCYYIKELFTLLLEDILVLLQKQDEKLILKCYSKNRAGSADTQHIFSPVIKLNTVLVRSVATGKLLYRHTHIHTPKWAMMSIYTVLS